MKKTNNVSLAIKVIALAIVMVSCLIFFVGCFFARNPFLVAVNYEETPYDIDNVTLEFCYGVSKHFIPKGLRESGQHVYGDAHIFLIKDKVPFAVSDSLPFDYTYPAIQNLKTIPRLEFFSEKYMQENRDGVAKYFNHSEMITVPSEFFIGYIGSFHFYLQIDHTSYTRQDDHSPFRIEIWYRLVDNKVTIIRYEQFP